MIDAERRKFLKMGLKLITISSALAATYPLQNLYGNKVKPLSAETIQSMNIPEHIDFSKMNSVLPQILASSAIMSLIMIYADSLQNVFLILGASLFLFLLWMPLTELTLGYFF
tara:strand:- start:9261 stop:9599 length:339 start_codon:yes stop_codon:yes gene_type:complete